MATQKITQAQWDTIGRHVLKQTGGINGLLDVVLEESATRYPNLSYAAAATPRNGGILIYEDDKYQAMRRWKIAARDPAKKYNELTARAITYLIQDYLKKHNYELFVSHAYATPRLGIRSKKTGKIIRK